MLNRRRVVRAFRSGRLRPLRTSSGRAAKLAAAPSTGVRHALTLYADEGFFDIDIALLYGMFPNLLSFETAIGGVRVPGPPRVTLSAEDDVHDVTVTVPVELKVLGTTHYVKVFLRGWVEIEDGVAQLGRLDVDVDAESGLAEDILDSLFDRMVGAARQASLVRVPTLEKVFGRDLDARVVDARIVEVRGRPMFRVTASVGPDPSEPVAMPMPDLLARNPPPEGIGRLVVMVPEAAINTLIDALLDRYVHDIRLRVGPEETRIRIKGRIRVNEPSVSLRDDHLEAFLDIDFKGLKAGIEFMGMTEWSKLKLKDLDASIEASIVSTDDGRDVTLVLGDIHGVKARFKNGGGMDSQLFERAIKDALAGFNRVLRQRLAGKQFTLIDTPETVMIAASKVTVTTGPTGPLIRKGAFIADLHFDMIGDDPATDLAEYWHFQKLSGGLTHVIDRGSGRPVIFIPDFLGDVETWNGQLGGLARWFRVVSYAWRGMGRSQGGRLPYRFGALVSDLLQLCKELDLDRPVLVGQGIGARIAARFALKHPDKVGGLVFVAGADHLFDPGFRVRLFQKGAPGPMPSGLARRFFARRMPLVAERMWHPRFVEEQPDVIAAWKERFLQRSPWRAMTAMWAVRIGRIRAAHVRQLGLPMAIVRGDEDERHAEIIEALGIEVLAVPGRSAMPMVEQTEAFNGAVRDFVERHLLG